MLTITASQLDGIAALGLAAYLRARFPDDLGRCTEPQLLQMVEAARAEAGRFRIEDPADVRSFLDLTVMYGPRFFEESWAQEVLDLADWDGARRMEALRQRVRRRIPDFR